jgi:hypothetical protein
MSIEFYFNTGLIINRYIAMSILMYDIGCKRKFYNSHLISQCKNKKVMGAKKPQNTYFFSLYDSQALPYLRR